MRFRPTLTRLDSRLLPDAAGIDPFPSDPTQTPTGREPTQSPPPAGPADPVAPPASDPVNKG